MSEDDLVVDPDQALKAGEQKVTWDFSGEGFADRITIGDMPPDVFIVFGDDRHEVTVIVMSVEYFCGSESAAALADAVMDQ